MSLKLETNHAARKRLLGTNPTPWLPHPIPGRLSTQHRGHLAPWPPLPTWPWPPLPCASLSRSRGCPHQEYLLTRLALLATLTTNMLSDKVGRKKVLELKTMSEITPHPHQVRVRWGLQTGHPSSGQSPGGGFCHSHSHFSPSCFTSQHRACCQGTKGWGWF